MDTHAGRHRTVAWIGTAVCAVVVAIVRMDPELQTLGGVASGGRLDSNFPLRDNAPLFVLGIGWSFLGWSTLPAPWTERPLNPILGGLAFLITGTVWCALTPARLDGVAGAAAPSWWVLVAGSGFAVLCTALALRRALEDERAMEQATEAFD
ncbi:MAG: hypothetical protein QNJ98_19400 [Planctomycetota bacterium]|nr:hypothetical protein [Planctomycetota bacterium]